MGIITHWMLLQPYSQECCSKAPSLRGDVCLVLHCCLLLCQASCPAWSSGLCGCCEEGRTCLLLPITYFFKEGGSSSAWIPGADFPHDVSGFCDLGDSMELGRGPHAGLLIWQQLFGWTASRLPAWLWDELKAFPAQALRVGMCHHNMGVPRLGTSGSPSHTQHLFHVNKVLYWGQALPHALSTSSVWVSGSSYAAISWLNCELNFNRSDESGCLPLSLQQLLSWPFFPPSPLFLSKAEPLNLDWGR